MHENISRIIFSFFREKEEIHVPRILCILLISNLTEALCAPISLFHHLQGESVAILRSSDVHFVGVNSRLEPRRKFRPEEETRPRFFAEGTAQQMAVFTEDLYARGCRFHFYIADEIRWAHTRNGETCELGHTRGTPPAPGTSLSIAWQRGPRLDNARLHCYRASIIG